MSIFSQAISPSPGLDVSTGYGGTIGETSTRFMDEAWSNVYLDQFTGRLIDELYGRTQFPGNKHLVSAIDSTFGSQYDTLVSEIIDNALMNLGMHSWNPQNLVDKGLLEVMVKHRLPFHAKCSDTGSLYNELVRTFVFQALGTDLRIPKPTHSGFGPIKAIDRNNVASLALKLGRNPHQSERVVILAAINSNLRNFVDETFLPSRTWQI